MRCLTNTGNKLQKPDGAFISSYSIMDDIKNIIRKQQESKTEQISITLSKKTLKDIEDEKKRLDIDNRSFLIEMILRDYFMKQITSDEGDKKE